MLTGGIINSWNQNNFYKDTKKKKSKAKQFKTLSGL